MRGKESPGSSRTAVPSTAQSDHILTEAELRKATQTYFRKKEKKMLTSQERKEVR